jgi:Amt family ammonium transporter
VESDITPLELRAAGFSGHLIKPVRQSRLYDSIVEAMAPKSRHVSAAGATAPTGNPLQSDSVDASPRGRILIAEDNRVNQIVASEILARYGYGSDIADNGKKAVAAVLAGGYDLVLMDCSMPEMDGFEATRLIRRAEESDPTRLPRHMPIIALTANAINGDRERCIETGMDDYVSKPIDPSRLIKSIEGLLAKSAEASPTDAAIKTPAVAAAMPTTVAGHATPPLGIEALLERCMGNAQTIALILTEFEQQAVTDLADLKRHVEGGDCEATARVAHALKGAAAILSADALSGTAFKLERMGRAGVFADEENVLAELNAEVRRCIDYLPTARAAIAKKIEV